jgi:hypothetical protein
MKQSIVWCALSAALFTAPLSAIELPSDEVLVAKVNAVDEGLQVTRKLEMTMTDKRGKSRQRSTVSYRKFFGDEKRSILFYQKPNNVKGTGFMTFDYADKQVDDDQWLYLPALRKVRRISSSDRGDYFLGTDLTYEDMKLEGKLEPKDYRYKVLGETTVDNQVLINVLATPLSGEIAKELGYSKVEFTVDSSNWIVISSQYWGLRGRPLKSLYATEIRLVDNIWTRHKLTIENHRSGHKTVFTFSDVDYKTQIKDGLFRKNALARGR